MLMLTLAFVAQVALGAPPPVESVTVEDKAWDNGTRVILDWTLPAEADDIRQIQIWTAGDGLDNQLVDVLEAVFESESVRNNEVCLVDSRHLGR